MLKVILKDLTSGDEWHESMHVLPQCGDEMWVGRAPKGTLHVVRNIVHRVDHGEHSIVINMDQVRPYDGLGPEKIPKNWEHSKEG